MTGSECHYCQKTATWKAEFAFVNNFNKIVPDDRHLCAYHAGIMKRVRDRKKYHIALRAMNPTEKSNYHGD